MSTYPAHIRSRIQTDPEPAVIQTVEEHCRAAASYAKASLSVVGLSNAAYLAGLLHDFGKFTQAFSDYIQAASRGESVRVGSVNHTFAGVRYLLQNFHCGKMDAQDFTCELLAYAIGAHHGLFDLMQDGKEYGFPHRISCTDNHYEEAEAAFLKNCADRDEIEALFQRSVEELSEKFSVLVQLSAKNAKISVDHLFFYIGMLARLLLSAVIEGDRRDTAEFMQDAPVPALPQDIDQLWRECLCFLEQKLSELPKDTPIRQTRAEISDRCRARASDPPGVYRLNLPTGGGKTLTSLRYALAHAEQHRKKRILFVIPLLSIIDQNSKVIREYLPRNDMILEHHSNIIRAEEGGDELDRNELLAESWSAPIIITTLVQLLNTLFSGKTTSIRRFQALCDSVIIFDEVQSVPTNMLSLFDLAVNFLSEVCGATVILCSATQPYLETVPHPLAKEPQDLVPYDEMLWEPFRRTVLTNAGDCTQAELPQFVLDKLAQHRSLLVVCNKRDEAEALFRALDGRLPHLFHLSASMCMAHRRDTLEQLSRALSPDSGIEDGILCVSTQVIEAGVDISFDCVIRLLAGMDSAVQAAGRCNRNGEANGISQAYLLNCADENLTKLREIHRAKAAAEALLAEFDLHPETYHNDLSSDEAIRLYYSYLHRHMESDAMDFPLLNEKENSKNTILDLLSQNKHQISGLRPKYLLHQSFATAGRAFQVFEGNTIDVIIPYNAEACRLIANLTSERAKYDTAFVKDTLQKLRPYTIGLYPWQFDKLNQQNAFSPVMNDAALVLRKEFYHKKTGLCKEPLTDPQAEVNICDSPIL